MSVYESWSFQEEEKSSMTRKSTMNQRLLSFSVEFLWSLDLKPLPPHLARALSETISDLCLFFSQNYHGYNLQKSINIRVTKKEEFTLRTMGHLTAMP